MFVRISFWIRGIQHSKPTTRRKTATQTNWSTIVRRFIGSPLTNKKLHFHNVSLGILSQRSMSSGWRFIDGLCPSGCFTSAAKVIHVYMWCRFCSEIHDIRYVVNSWAYVYPNSHDLWFFIDFCGSCKQVIELRSDFTKLSSLQNCFCTRTNAYIFNQSCAWQCAIIL